MKSKALLTGLFLTASTLFATNAQATTIDDALAACGTPYDATGCQTAMDGFINSPTGGFLSFLSTPASRAAQLMRRLAFAAASGSVSSNAVGDGIQLIQDSDMSDSAKIAAFAEALNGSQVAAEVLEELVESGEIGSPF